MQMSRNSRSSSPKTNERAASPLVLSCLHSGSLLPLSPFLPLSCVLAHSYGLISTAPLNWNESIIISLCVFLHLSRHYHQQHSFLVNIQIIKVLLKSAEPSEESKNDSLCIDSDLMYLFRFGLGPDPFNTYNASLWNSPITWLTSMQK